MVGQLRTLVLVIGALMIMHSWGITQEESSEQQNSIQEDPLITPSPPDAVTSPEDELAPPSSLEEESGEEDTDLFYNSEGFRLFRPIKVTDASTLEIRNVVKNAFLYDSNVELVDDNRVEDVVYTLNWQTELKYQWRRMVVELSGGFIYEDFFDEDVDEFLPRVLLRSKYEGEIFYFALNGGVERDSVIENIEFSDRSAFVSHRLQAVAGFRYARYLLELTSRYEYLDFRDIEGDFQNYGQTLLAGYELTRRLYATVDFTWDHIDYREAFDLAIADEAQEDTTEYALAVGARFRLANHLEGFVRIGGSILEGEIFPFVRSTLGWQISPQWEVSLTGAVSNEPSFFGDFQTLTVGTFQTRYLLTSRLGVSYATSVSYSHPDEGEDTFSYQNRVVFTYRIYKGVEGELFGEADFLRTDQEVLNDDDGRDYNVFRVGTSINVIF